MNDLVKILNLVKSGEIPLWIAIIIGVSILLNCFLPFFKFRYEMYKDKRDEKRENFLKAINAMGDLNKSLGEFAAFINDLKSNKIETSDLTKYVIIDKFLENLMTICDGVEQGFMTKTGNISQNLNCVLKHKYDKRDNLIIDVYNAVKKVDKSFNEPLRIDEYDVLFRVYKSGFPFHKRLIGLFYTKIFDIK